MLTLRAGTGGVHCSRAAEPADAWATRTREAVHAHFALSPRRRNATQRRKAYVRTCDTTETTGLGCDFLEGGTRWELPGLLGVMRYTGASADVGVGRGNFSAHLLERWRGGGTHLAVATHQHHSAHSGDSGGAYERTRARLLGAAPTRAVLLRNSSLGAVRALSPTERFDLVHLSGRHAAPGFGRELAAWLPRVCPGGY